MKRSMLSRCMIFEQINDFAQKSPPSYEQPDGSLTDGGAPIIQFYCSSKASNLLSRIKLRNRRKSEIMSFCIPLLSQSITIPKQTHL